MDDATREVYERQARAWIAARRPVAVEDGRIDRFASRLAPGARVADLGSGPAWYAEALAERGLRAVALDVAGQMLRAARERAPQLPCVCADLARLPFARGSLDGALALNAYQHLPLAELAPALAHLHDALAPDAPLELTLTEFAQGVPDADRRGLAASEQRPMRSFPGRLFSAVSIGHAQALLEGAGFRVLGIEPDGFWLRIRALRAFTLPDFVRPGLRLLVCGLNPSRYAAERGVPFARPGNRFWPAARAAGLVKRDRAPFAALEEGVGLVDLVKRATRSAAELSLCEYREGVERVDALIRRERPRTVVFVGLDGWRKALDRRAQAGWVEGGFAGARAYLMPSTSGLNARTSLETLSQHLARAAS